MPDARSPARTLVRRRFINFLRYRVDVTERVVTEFRRAFHEAHSRITRAFRQRTFFRSLIAQYTDMYVPPPVAFSMTAAVTTSSCARSLSLSLFLSPSARRSSAGLRNCHSHQFPRRTVAGNPNGPGKQKWRPLATGAGSHAATRVSRKA